jgi:hypothetical protein
VRRLVTALALAAVCAPLARAAPPAPRPHHLSRPPFPAATTASARAGTLELEVVSSKPNAITDEAAWLRRNRIRLREYAVPGSLGDLPLPVLPAGLPTTIGGLRLTRAIYQPDGRKLLVYGEDFSTGHLLVSPDRFVFDFASYANARPGSLVYQQVVWAAEAGRMLYVETAHSTYASSSGGRNAYVTAIDLQTGRLKWRAGPLVGNAQTFELVGGVIVAGYGFTGEPDYLYVLDRTNGTVISRTPVPSAPEYVVRKGSLLYVRTYDHDLVVKLVRTR